MTEADILAATYRDSCNVFRRNFSKDSHTKQTRQEEVLVYENISCALSTPSGGGFDSRKGVGGYQSGYTLFCRPDQDIAKGDKLVVTTEAGAVFTLWAGRPFSYAGSHMEVPLSEEERA